MNRTATSVPQATTTAPIREPLIGQIASFAELFVWLLILKHFLLPLFIIPTGSMAETLAGAHAIHACPNCGYEYQIGMGETIPLIECPNCGFFESTGATMREGIGFGTPEVDLKARGGDRIVVLSWPFEFGGALGPKAWDVVVFKNPNRLDQNYIKRLIGLPGQKIEIVDGDVYVNDEVARKTDRAQQSLWFPYYDHDFIPLQPSRPKPVKRGQSVIAQYGPRPYFHPRWVAVDDASGWEDLDQRVIHCDAPAGRTQSIRFVTDAAGAARVVDRYGYNSPQTSPPNIDVTDYRLSADVTFTRPGVLEFMLNKYGRRFRAQLTEAGEITLLAETPGSNEWEMWGAANVGPIAGGNRFALAHVDNRVLVELNGATVLESSSEQYALSPREARLRRVAEPRADIRIRVDGAAVALAHVRIDRDVHYMSERVGGGPPGTGVEGNPIQLGPKDYFCMGDNSPRSHDCRWWSKSELSAMLRARLDDGEYQVGTVPADQMIGRAILVYWPGFRGNPAGNVGRIRWIN